MAARDEIQHVAAALERPRPGYFLRFEHARTAVAARSGEAARQLGVFVERIADLTLDELRELHDETFGPAAMSRVLAVALALVRHPATCGDARLALNALTPMLERLEADRNPFAYVVRALCCLLLTRVDRSPMARTAPCPAESPVKAP
jgi:nitrate reductase assembly molybdenum cofactor insertion protein NarJ